MKILTITCHNVFNHGAALQEFALIRYINSLGYQAKAINYQPPYLSNSYKLLKVSNPRWNKNFITRIIYILLKLPSKLFDIKRQSKFKRFNEKYIPETEKLYKCNRDLKLSPPKADIFICGSDQIWNTIFENGKDPAFYLDFVPKGVPRIAYAASFASEKIDDSFQDFVRSMILNIHRISVREASALKILADLNIFGATRVVDPVFLIEKSLWIEKFTVKNDDQFLLIYDFDNSQLIKEIALETARVRNLKIYALNKRINYADKTFWNIGPDEFVNMISNAHLVLTNSFHGVCFSLILEKNFYAFNRNEKINTRILDLLKLCNLENRLIEDRNDLNLLEDLNYEEINQRLNEAIVSSKDFIHSSLNHQFK